MPVKYFCIGILLLLSGCASPGSEWQIAPIPQIRSGATVHLRVAHAVNERLASMSPAQLRIMLDSAQLTMQQNFGVNIEFDGMTEITAAQLFAQIPVPVRELSKQSIYDFKSGTGDRNRLAIGIHTTLTQRGTRLEDALAFAAPYLPPAQPQDLRELSELLADVMLERLEKWRKVNAADSLPVLNVEPYNEWVYWDAAGYGELPYELVITNQLIASAEYADVDVHSAIRGGVSVGTTTYSHDSRYGAYVFWSTFPFQDNSELTQQLRGGEHYSETEAAELAGTYLAHEIGHLLFRFGHPFGQQACIMNPVSMLRFREWSRQINSARCAIGSLPEMTVGATPIYYNANWRYLSPAH